MRILIVEDNRDIAENIADYLTPLGYSLDFSAEGRQGFNLACDNSFDVIVLDLMLPGMDGLTLCHRLRTEKKVATPILMLTARDQLDDKLKGFQAGADDYLVKPFSVKELEVRLKALSKRSRDFSDTRILQVSNLQYDPTTAQVSRDGQLLSVNPMQRKLLQILMQNSHRVVSKEELEFQIWGDSPPDNDILRSHIYSLRGVIDKPFDGKLLHTIHGAGYRLAEL